MLKESSQISYLLDVKKRKELLTMLLDNIPIDSMISFEGNLAKHVIPKYLYANDEQGVLTRNITAPKHDFWVFKLNKETKDYLKRDFLSRIGLRKNVIHILIENDNKLLFASYDNFDEDCVWVKTSTIISENFLDLLAEKRIIKEYKKISPDTNIEIIQSRITGIQRFCSLFKNIYKKFRCNL